MSRKRGICCLAALILLTVFALTAPAETQTEEAEQGLEEIQPLLQMADVKEEEGMSLEEMTDAFTETAMSEYLDSATGFSMQYPSIFLFEEEQGGSTAATADGKATLSIEHLVNESGFSETELTEAIRLEHPDADIRKNEQNGCLRIDRTADGGETGQTDLYLLTEHSFHHIVLRYPAEEQGTYFTYIEYMINTMESDETDLG